jgi:hypothetical protein
MTTMKVLIGAACFALSSVYLTAQTASTSTGGSPAVAASEEASGTITEYTADSALVLNTGSGDPVHYRFAKKVTYVDADGKELQSPGLRKNLRVRVHYVRNGGDLIVDKVTLLE